MIGGIAWGLLTGSDNLCVGAAVGLAPMPARRRVLFSVAFGFCEIGMTFLGWSCGLQSRSNLCGSVAFALTGALVFLSWTHGTQLERLVHHRTAPVLLPLGLSLDNLAAGASLASKGSPALTDVVTLGLVSAALAATTLFAAGAFAKRHPRLVARPALAFLIAGAALKVLGLLG